LKAQIILAAIPPKAWRRWQRCAGIVAGQTDSSPSMAGMALLMPVNRAGAVEYEIDENNGIKA
jgi:hypothetical protein